MTGGVGNEVKFAMGNVRWKDASHDSQNLAWTKKKNKKQLERRLTKKSTKEGNNSKSEKDV